MNRKIILYFIILFCVLISCQNKQKTYERVFNYDNGNIKYRKVYANKEEYDLDKNYIGYFYYPNGILKYEIEFRNQKQDGTLFEYTEKGELKQTSQYKKNISHGILKGYNTFGEIDIENLFINGKRIIGKQFVYFDDCNLWGYGIFKCENDTTQFLLWEYVIDENKNPIDSESKYYVATSKKDTINFGEEYELDIQILTEGRNDQSIWLEIGELNENLEFVDTTAIERLFYGSEKRIQYSTKKYNEGNNLILGKIYLGKDTVVNNDNHILGSMFVLYKDFYVKKANK